MPPPGGPPTRRPCRPSATAPPRLGIMTGVGGPTSGSATGSAALPRRRAVAAVRDLDPGSFAFVMATGIISTGAYLLGPSWLSRALLVVTAAGLVVLTAALLFRLALFWPRV